MITLHAAQPCIGGDPNGTASIKIRDAAISFRWLHDGASLADCSEVDHPLRA